MGDSEKAAVKVKIKYLAVQMVDVHQGRVFEVWRVFPLNGMQSDELEHL